MISILPEVFIGGSRRCILCLPPICGCRSGCCRCWGLRLCRHFGFNSSSYVRSGVLTQMIFTIESCLMKRNLILLDIFTKCLENNFLKNLNLSSVATESRSIFVYNLPFPHSWQTCFFSPEWMTICNVSCSFRLNDFIQICVWNLKAKKFSL